MFERQDLLDSFKKYQSLGNYQILLNILQATADFMFDISKYLLCYASSVTFPERKGRNAEEIVRVRDERRRIADLAHFRKNKTPCTR